MNPTAHRSANLPSLLCLALLALNLVGPGRAEPSTPPDPALQKAITSDPDLPFVLDKARALLKSGLTAGSGYKEVWIRDLNTFIELSLQVNPPADLRSALLTFFKFQGTNGDIPDGFIPRERGSVGYKYRSSPSASGLLAHKNTVETDQETSLVQAIRRFVQATGDRSILNERVDGRTVLDRLESALQYVLTERFDTAHGLVWGATTVDWGDVQPEHSWGVELDSNSHRACDIYDNAMFMIAAADLIDLLGPGSPRAAKWSDVRTTLRTNIRKHLWDANRHKFIPHLYLDGSPFPSTLDEAAIYYHGGTAVAIEAGLLSHDEIARALADMRANVKAAGASSIGLTVYPVYPKGTFKNTGMGPYSYQNGGDWCWFGGRMIQQLVQNGFIREAYDELKPMLARVRKHGDFHEWWSLDNQPRGSAQFRGSAGVLGVAILQLQSATRNTPPSSPTPKPDAEGFIPLFNGHDLAGWDGKPGWWHVEDGCITAESTPEKPCTQHNYLVWRGGQPADFEIQFDYRLIGGNSGLQFRSRSLPNWDMSGYQADMEAGPEWTGALFEHERGGIALRGQKVVIEPDGKKQVTRFAEAAALQQIIHSNDWNHYRVVARGPEIQLFINGKKTAHAVDRQNGKAAAKGWIGLQMHPGPPMKVQFRNLRIKEFAPAAAATPAEKLSILPGFKAELLYSPAKENEGSWVSLCVDPRGRLYVSGQYDEGLFRITPAAPGADPTTTRVERIPVNLSGAQGLCWAFDSLYAVVSKNGSTPSGLYRIRDTNGDDQLDTVDTLRLLEGGGDHGWHAVLPSPDGKTLTVVAGNNTTSPPLKGSRVPPYWSEDHLLPRLPDAGGHMKGVLAPGGVIYHVSPDGQQWEMFAHGFRNTYDAAYDRNGELFTYDADMEWDMGTPWYRPTRVCQITSGAEFGWRNGTGKWPAYLPDSLPAIFDVGPGSPTGVTFGHGAAFPKKYQDALYLGDWTLGRIYALHLTPQGAANSGQIEVLLSGIPLPLTDIVINPVDGALYFITGGWRIQTGLYRVTHPDGTKPSTPTAAPATDLLSKRHQLERFHGHQDPAAVPTAWPYLDHPDRFLRFAARVAIEWQNPTTWKKKALTESKPGPAIEALLALTRVSARDEFHRKPSDTPPDPTLQSQILAALGRLNWTHLDERHRIDYLRVHTLCFTRLGPPSEADRTQVLARLEPRFPTQSRALNSELCQLLVYLQSDQIAAKALERIHIAPTQEEQLDYIKSLRMLQAGWTPRLRADYFGWFNRAAGYRGGASFAGFLKMIKADALAPLRESERAALKPILEAPAPASPQDAFSAFLAGRTQSTEWSVATLAPGLESQLKNRNLERGRTLFGAAGCFACHRFAGEGGAVGPDLTQAAGRFSPRDLLEAIIEPSKTISDLYANQVITQRDGESLTGRIVYLHEDSVSVNCNMFDPANTTRVDRKNIVSIETSKVSPMPEGLLNLLTRDEITDLIAYIFSGAK